MVKEVMEQGLGEKKQNVNTLVQKSLTFKF